MFTVTTNYNGATVPEEVNKVSKGYDGTYCNNVLIAETRHIDIFEGHSGSEPEETTAAEAIHNYSGNGWQGSKYDSSMTTKEIAAAIRKDLKAAYPGVKFSVRCKHASMCHEIIVNAVSGTIRDYSAVSTVEELEAIGGDPMAKRFIDGWRCNYYYNFALNRCTTEEEKAAYLAEVPTPEFKKMQEDVKAIVKAYNYDDSDSMVDYFDVNFYEEISFSSYEYKAPAEPATPHQTEKTAETTEGIKCEVCGVECEVSDETDTRDGSPLTVVRISEKIERYAFNEFSQEMKRNGGYYSRFKRGFIFRSRPEFLAMEENTGTATAKKSPHTDTESEKGEIIPPTDEKVGIETENSCNDVSENIVDPATVAEGDEIVLKSLKTGNTIKSVFISWNPETNAIKAKIPGIIIPKVYHIGGNVQIIEHNPKSEIVAENEKRYSVPDKKYIDTVKPSALQEGGEVEIFDLLTGEKISGEIVEIKETDEDGATILLRSSYFNNFAEYIDIGVRNAVTNYLPKAAEPEEQATQPKEAATESTEGGESAKNQKINYIATVRVGANETNTAFELVNCEYFETLEGAKKYISDNKNALENWAGGYVANFADGVVVYEDMGQPETEDQTADERAETVKEAAEYYKRVKAGSGSYILATIRTTEKFIDKLTDGEILRAIETAESDPEDPTEPPKPTKPSEESNNSIEQTDNHPEPIREGVESVSIANIEPQRIIVPELPKNLIRQANGNSFGGTRGSVSAGSYAAYCAEVIGWEIADSKKQKIVDKLYKKYLPIITAEARHVSVMVAGPAKYNSRKLDHGEEVLRNSAEFCNWFDEIRRSVKNAGTTGHEERVKKLIEEIKYCIRNNGKDKSKIPLDWNGMSRNYLESLAVLNQVEFIKMFEECNEIFNYRTNTKIYKLYSKAKKGEQIAAEKKEIFSDENLTAYTEGGRVYIRFITKPQQQLRFALKKRGYWWNSNRSEWSTYIQKIDIEFIKNISSRYKKYI